MSDINEQALYYGLGATIALFALILFILCVCLCYFRFCRKRSPAPKVQNQEQPVSFTGNFEDQDNVSDNDPHPPYRTDHLYEDLDTLKLAKKRLEQKKKQDGKQEEMTEINPDPENGEQERAMGNGHAVIVTVNERDFSHNGHIQITNGPSPMDIGMPVAHGRIPSDQPMSNGGISNGGMANGGLLNGLARDGLHNGELPNGGRANGEVPDGGILSNNNNNRHSSAVFTAQLPSGYHTRASTLPAGATSRDDQGEPIYAKLKRYSKTGKKKKPPKVKFNVPKGMAPGDTLPKSPPTPKTPEVPPKLDVMY